MKTYALLGQYIREMDAQGASPHTGTKYQNDIGQLLAFAGVTNVEDLSCDLVRTFLAELDRLGYAKSSIARRVSELRSFGKFLVREGALERNMFLTIRTPRIPKRLPQYLTVAEVEALLDGIDTSTLLGLRNRAIIEVLYAAGLRVSELVGLDVTDVDIAQKQVRVMGKGGKERIGLLGRQAMQAIRVYLKVHSGPGPLWLSASGNRLTARDVHRLVRSWGSRLDVIFPPTSFATLLPRISWMGGQISGSFRNCWGMLV